MLVMRERALTTTLSMEPESLQRQRTRSSVRENSTTDNRRISPTLPPSLDTLPVVTDHVNFEQSLTSQVDSQQQTLARHDTKSTSQSEPLFSVFTRNQKRFIVFIAAWAGFFSAVSATIYFPALNALAYDLNVSHSLINLTLTSYMIFQGLAPAFIGNLADTAGRRPAYLVCFVIYIGANIGLAVQNSYAALFVLRCLQSTGSSATIAMASAVVSDIATPAERGKYMGFTLGGTLISSAVGPVLGGILTEFLSWRAIFWFLTIFSGIFLVVCGIFFPETARSIVGNGSITPKGLNMSLINYLAIRKSNQKVVVDAEHFQTSTNNSAQFARARHRFPNPLASIKIIFDKASALLLLNNAFLFAAFYDVSASIPSQFAASYQYNDLQIGLCYIPFGVGTILASLVNGQLVDRYFRYHCKKLGVSIKKGRGQDLSNFPIEKVRLRIALPAYYMSSVFVLIFGWVLHFSGPVSVLLVVLFFMGFAMAVSFNVTSTLLIDFYPTSTAVATAANNLVRCLLGAGATALIVPMMNAMGVGWTYTLLGLFLIATSPMLWILMWKGMGWRKLRLAKEEKKRQGKAERSITTVMEEGDTHHEIVPVKSTSQPR